MLYDFNVRQLLYYPALGLVREEPITATHRIRGTQDGLTLSLGEGIFREQLASLEAELRETSAFWSGSRVVLEVGGRRVTRPQLLQAQRLLLEHGMELWAVLGYDEETRDAARSVGLATRQPGSATDLNGRTLPDPPMESSSKPVTPSKPSEPRYVKETIRSGQSIYHEGPVVIVGDVNPGAEVVAGGDVIVWGKVRGLIHAGAFGDESAVVCALELTPTQLRIAMQIAISPNGRRENLAPEVAAIIDGQIVARPWHAKG